MYSVFEYTRKKRKSVLAIGAAGLILSSCTPDQAILVQFSGELETARRVAKCESNYDASAVSPTNDHGLFQINATTWNQPGHPDEVADFIGRNWDKRYNPMWNAYFAKLIRDKYGWKMWSCY